MAERYHTWPQDHCCPPRLRPCPRLGAGAYHGKTELNCLAMLTRPELSELEPPYHASFERVPEGNVLEIMAREIEDTTRLLDDVSDERADYRYAPGKWSIKEVIGHLADTERVMSYRALAIARGETVDLPGYEQDDYVVAGRFDRRRISDLSREFRAIRTSTLALFEGFDDDVLLKRGRASGCTFTVRALAYLICGHEIHHKKILRERYLET